MFSVLLSRYDVSCDVYYQRKDDVKESVERCRVIDPTLFLDVERLLEEADAVGRLISGLKDFLALEKVICSHFFVARQSCHLHIQFSCLSRYL